LELNEASLHSVRAAFRERNVDACRRGLPTCDPSLLTGPDMASVTAAFQQRRKAATRFSQAKP
jgi:hypothetical protein